MYSRMSLIFPWSSVSPCERELWSFFHLCYSRTLAQMYTYDVNKMFEGLGSQAKRETPWHIFMVLNHNCSVWQYCFSISLDVGDGHLNFSRYPGKTMKEQLTDRLNERVRERERMKQRSKTKRQKEREWRRWPERQRQRDSHRESEKEREA